VHRKCSDCYNVLYHCWHSTLLLHNMLLVAVCLRCVHRDASLWLRAIVRPRACLIRNIDLGWTRLMVDDIRWPWWATNQPTNQLTKSLLEKRIFARMVSKFVTFDEFPMYVVPFTTVCDHIQQISSREVSSFLGSDALSLGYQIPTYILYV